MSTSHTRELLFTGAHESLGRTETQRLNESLLCLVLAGDGGDCWTAQTSQELAWNVLPGCEHYGNEDCSCETWDALNEDEEI